MGKTMFNKPLLPGSELSIGGKEIEIDSVMAREDYLKGKAFLSTGNKQSPIVVDDEKKSRPLQKLKISKKAREFLKEEEGKQDAKIKRIPLSVPTTAFKTPLLVNHIQQSTKDELEPVARHDPKTLGAVVMTRPKSIPKGKRIVDVVVDPILSQHLRDHQREGVKFMYECVMGMKAFDGQGCILADEMGLGKTLQTMFVHPSYFHK
jgi:DNA repair and recombination protein RAD54B